jgi:hypothetical protein
MSNKKISWLEKFAEDQEKKISKTASLNKKAEQTIVDTEDIPGAADGQVVTFNGLKYNVVNASYQDELGTGILLPGR